MASVVISGDTSGSATLQAQAIAGNTVLTLPTTSGTFITTTGGVTPGSNGNILTSNGTSWTSATPAGGIGIGQTWQLPARSASTTYTNSTGKPIFISIAFGQSLSGSGSSNVTIGGVLVYSVGYGSNASGSSQPIAISLIVPDGSTYVVTVSGSVSIAYWAELR